MKQFKNILCAVSTDESSRITLERAISLAEKNRAQLTVADVLPRPPKGVSISIDATLPTDLQTKIQEERLQDLQAMTRPFQQRLPILHKVLMGSPFLEIIRTVLLDGHDLLIKPAENPKFVKRLFGSNDKHLLRKCPCPVWLTQPKEKPVYRCVMAAVDFDPEGTDSAELDINRQIIELSSTIALSDSATLHLVHTWDAPGEMTVRVWSDNPDEAAARYVKGEHLRHQRGLKRLRQSLIDQLGPEVYDHLAPHLHLRRGAASRMIPKIAEQLHADLVVMGTIARSGISGLLIGNTAEDILEQLKCSILAVKPSGFVTPVRVAGGDSPG
ncbi:MAG: universal stress protein [Desulfobulbaceae bacterium]|jgi:nucleotide-binding universal stress UspA family protein|nr:universal stress protein [Desulfobulbaceae bacterium]